MATLNATLIFETGGSVTTTIKEHAGSLYIVQQQGIIYIRGVGVFINITNQVLLGAETGLLGLSFYPIDDIHPVDTTRFFIWYSEKPNTAPPGFDHINRLEEWRIIGGVPQRYVTLLRLLIPQSNHNGLDNIFYDQEIGRLVLATGDGGSSATAQDNNSLLGKVISFNVDDPIWLSMENNTPISQVSQLGVFASAISVVSKGLRNPTRIDKKSGVKFISVAGQSNREFGFCFTTYNKNFGWRAFEGDVPTVSGTTVSFPTEVIQLLYTNETWPSIVNYANSAAAGLPPLPSPIIRGNAMTGIDYYQGNIPGLTNNLIFIDLNGQILTAPLPQGVPEAVLKTSQFVSPITVNGLTGTTNTTMYITSANRILVARGVFGGPTVISRVYSLGL